MGPEGRAAAPRGIIFDLDGTLIDSRRDIATAINRMRSEHGLPPLSVEEVGGMVGEGARKLVRRALPPGPVREDLKPALASYLEHYSRVCLDTTRPYPGVPAMLAVLAPSFSLAVLSNKGEALSRRILAGLGLDRYLREVVGGDTLPTRKPNPGGLFLLADRFGLPPRELLLVGDSQVDALTAQAAGCPFALAVWGADSAGSPAPDPPDAAEAAEAAELSEPAEPAELAATHEPPEAAQPAAMPAIPVWRFAQPGEVAVALGLSQDAED